jgi:hypothetical protein
MQIFFLLLLIRSKSLWRWCISTNIMDNDQKYSIYPHVSFFKNFVLKQFQCVCLFVVKGKVSQP